MNISPISELALSVKVQVKAASDYPKFQRFNPNSF
jgi:hypothetical protein